MQFYQHFMSISIPEFIQALAYIFIFTVKNELLKLHI